MLRTVLKGRGLWERVLCSIGSGNLYDRLSALQAQCAEFRRLLASGGDRLQVERRLHHIGQMPGLHSVLAPFWQHPSLAGAYHYGGAFFFRIAA